jgi:cytochrome c553
MYTHLRIAVVFVFLLGGAPALADEVRAEMRDEQLHNALQLDVDPERGRRLYAQQCAECHGRAAHGDGALPSLAGQRQAYLVKRLADLSALDADSPHMHGVLVKWGLTEDPQAWVDLAAYLNRAPVLERPGQGDGAHLQFGEAIYREQCASCHEADGRGDDDGFVPALRNQHYGYLLAATRKLGAWARHNVEPDLARFLESFEEDEIQGLADYLSRLQGPVQDRSRLREDGSVGD